MNTGAMSAAQPGKGAMRAGLAAPDARVVHARQIVENEGGRVRELYPTSRGKNKGTAVTHRFASAEKRDGSKRSGSCQSRS